MTDPSDDLEARIARALAAARTDSRLRVTPWADGAQRVVRASRRKRTHRAAMSVTVVSALVLAAIGGSYAYVGHQLHTLQTSSLAGPLKGLQPPVHPLGGQATGQSESRGHLAKKPAAGQPFTLLILGTDSREGTGTKYGTDADACECSDTIILARVNPQDAQVSLLSVPRDTRVAIANTGKKAKLNSAFADGPDNTVATIEASLQIPINHWIVLDLAGFSSIVNAIHGIKLDFPYPIRDKNAGLYVNTTGCQTVDGDEALAISRSRELQYYANGKWSYDGTWENGRERREQILMRVIAAHTVKSSLSNPLTAASVVSTFTSHNRLAVDNQITSTELLDLAGDFAGFDAGTMKTFSLPTITTPIDVPGVGKQDFEILQPTPDVNTIEAWYAAVLPVAPPASPTAATRASSAPSSAVSQGAASAAATTNPAAPTTTAAAASTTTAPATTTAPVSSAGPVPVAPNQPAPFDPVPCS